MGSTYTKRGGEKPGQEKRKIAPSIKSIEIIPFWATGAEGGKKGKKELSHSRSRAKVTYLTCWTDIPLFLYFVSVKFFDGKGRSEEAGWGPTKPLGI